MVSNKQKCLICNFRYAHKHHIIKKINNGSDKSSNLIFLCPNHHWLADFGTEEEKKEILSSILSLSGKSGEKISEQEQNLLDLKIRALTTNIFGMFDNKFWEEYKTTSNYMLIKKWLIGRYNGYNPNDIDLEAKKILLTLGYK